MRTTSKIGAFFLLTIMFALPSYALVGLTARGVILTSDMAFSFIPLVTLAPLIAALVLTYCSAGWAGTMALLRRSFDFKRTKRKSWHLVALVAPPVIVLVAWVIAKMAGVDLLPPQAPFIAAIVMFIVFFGTALAEELGWMGYAYERMVSKWQTFQSALILGLIISAFHLPLYYFMIDDPVILAVQTLFPISLRLLVIWIYNNAGKSVFAATIFHAAYNTAYAVLEVNIPIATTLSVILALVALYYGTHAVWQEGKQRK